MKPSNSFQKGLRGYLRPKSLISLEQNGQILLFLICRYGKLTGTGGLGQIDNIHGIT